MKKETCAIPCLVTLISSRSKEGHTAPHLPSSPPPHFFAWAAANGPFKHAHRSHSFPALSHPSPHAQGEMPHAAPSPLP